RAAAAAARSELAVASREVGLPAQGRADQAGHVRVLAGVDVGDLATVVDVDVVVRHQAVLAGADGPVAALGQVDGGGAADGALDPRSPLQNGLEACMTIRASTLFVPEPSFLADMCLSVAVFLATCLPVDFL